MKRKTTTVTVVTLIALALLGIMSVWAASTTLIVTAFTFQDTDEFVQVKNISGSSISLDGYCIGDEETNSESEGMAALPAISLPAGDSIILARDADSWGYSTPPDYSFRDNSQGVPQLNDCTTWSGSTGMFGLRNSGDEVILIDSSGNLVDGACYGDSDCNFNGAGNNTILTDGALSTTDPGFVRQNDTDTDTTSDWTNNPTAVRLTALLASPGGVFIGLAAAAMLAGGLVVLRKRR